jgi:hypothetical protein
MKKSTESRTVFRVERTRPSQNSWRRVLLLLGRSGLGLEDLLDDVGLLDQECAGDPVSVDVDEGFISIVGYTAITKSNPPVLDATSTPGTTVCPLNGLLTLGKGGVCFWFERQCGGRKVSLAS